MFVKPLRMASTTTTEVRGKPRGRRTLETADNLTF